MSIFKQGENSCYFIHIPRTAGRYVSSLFESNNVECFHHKIDQENIGGIDITHLHYPLYNYFLNVKNIPHIAVVRDPFDKFNSCIRNMNSIHKTDYNGIMKTWDEFYEFVNVEIKIQSFHNNWFLPQNKFISNKTFIWKYESGFNQNFVDWIFDKTSIKINLHDNIRYDSFRGECNDGYKLNDNIKKYVKKFYRKDYQLFGYTL
jgi:hypothetical protein